MTRSARAPRRGPAGFTLVEMLTVLTVMLILLAAAAPSVRALLDSRRLAVATSEFLGAIHLARSEAIHRGERVDLLAVDNDWRKGWTVFVDRNRDRQPNAGDDIIFHQPQQAPGLEIESRLQDNGLAYLAYDGSGRSRTDASAQQPQFGTFRLRRGGQRRNIVLNMLGRPRVCTPAAGADSC